VDLSGSEPYPMLRCVVSGVER